MSTHVNLLGEPAPTLLPSLPEAEQLVSAGTPATEIAAKYPAFSLAWALLAEAALADNRYVDAYAYARTGYHRGLDALRRFHRNTARGTARGRNGLGERRQAEHGARDGGHRQTHRAMQCRAARAARPLRIRRATAECHEKTGTDLRRLKHGNPFFGAKVDR